MAKGYQINWYASDPIDGFDREIRTTEIRSDVTDPEQGTPYEIHQQRVLSGWSARRCNYALFPGDARPGLREFDWGAV
jgi:hypothetical protein